MNLGIMENQFSYSAGVDVGTESIKLVVLQDRNILFARTEVTEESGYTACRRLIVEVQRLLGTEEINRLPIISTGIGKKTVALARKNLADQICHARGARWLFPAAQTVLDIGASGCRGMRLNPAGKLVDFALNSKCASGTGAFLENMARLLETTFEGMSSLAQDAGKATQISNYCAVFAESEVISKIHRGESKGKIAAGIYEAVVDRLMEILRPIGLQKELVITGGVAMNRGLIRALENRTRIAAKIPSDPKIVGALGAALMAQDLG